MSRSGAKPAMKSAIVAVLLLAAAVAVASCGFGESGSAKSVSGAPARKPVAVESEMVAAVSASRAEKGWVDMRFALAKRPKVGDPFDVEVSLVPSVPLERLNVRFQAAEGLEIVSGGQTEQLENAPANVPIGHKVTVLAKADGIFYINAVVVADTEKDSISRAYSIPLIAGEGISAAPAVPPAASTSEPSREATPQ
jgi:hypothetical protein